MSCTLCRNMDFGNVGCDIDKFSNHLSSHIYLCCGNSKAPIEERFNYCPKCGALIIYSDLNTHEEIKKGLAL